MTAEDSRRPAEAPRLSVVLVAPEGYDTLRRTVAHLARQTVRDALEIVVVTPRGAANVVRAGELAPFAGWQVVESGPLHGVGAVRAAGVRAARAPVVAFGEDHSFPEAGWAEALAAAHASGWAAVGPVVTNANPGSAVSWAALFTGFAPWIEADGGPASGIPWHNSAYDRRLLLELGDRLPELLELESALQAELRSRGHRLFVAPGARTRHVNISHLRFELVAEFTAGWHFAAARRRQERWSRLRRGVAVLAAPAALPVRAARLVPHVRRVARRTRMPRATWLAIAASIGAHVAGEAVGAIAGEGGVRKRRADFEFRRERFLAARDAAVLREPLP